MLFNDRLIIQDTCRLTDTNFPFQSYITSESFPAQDSEKLGTEQYVRLRSDKHATYDEDNNKFIPVEVKYYVLRWDIELPYTTIGICTGELTFYKGCIIVFNNKATEELEESTGFGFDIVARYPEQKYNYFGANVKIAYSNCSFLKDSTNGIIVRVDQADPAHAVAAEITTDNKLRFVVSNEVAMLIDNYLPTDIDRDELYIYDTVEQLLGEYELYGK